MAVSFYVVTKWSLVYLWMTLICVTECAKQPHILFVLADDYGWNDIGYHGSEIKTPTLDKLASEGVKLENYYVQPICTPSRSQLMSGRYQIHTGLQHDTISASQPLGLPLELPTLADKLKEVGYSTHLVGKWHLGFFKSEYMPTYRGFDTAYGYLTGREDYLTHSVCSSLNHHYCGYDFHANTEVDKSANGSYSARLFASRAIDIVANHNKDEPLFLYLPFQSVHEPFEAPQEYIDMYKNISDKTRRIFAGMVSIMDEAVKNVTDAFVKYGLWDDTVMVFSTDNGGPKGSANNWPLRGYKRTLWEGGVHGVGFVNSPLLKVKNYINQQFIHISDWFPTLVNLGGGSVEGLKLDGYNQWDTISMNQQSPRTELLHNIDPKHAPVGKRLYENSFDNRIRAAIRVGDMKLLTGDVGEGTWTPPPHLNSQIAQSLENDTQNIWLFNITADPTEHNDLSERHPDIVKQLLDRLAFYNSTAVPCMYPRSDPQADPELHGGNWVPWKD